MKDIMIDELAAPEIVDRSVFQEQLDALRVREKAHTHEGDAIAAARRRLPMVEVDSTTKLIGPHGPVTLLDAFEGRQQLIAYYFMWHAGHPAPEQCEGCTWVTIAGPRAVLYSFSRRHLRYVLPGPLRRERPVPRLHGLGDALVLGPAGLARDSPGWTPEWAGCTLFAICGKDPKSSRLTGPRRAAFEVMDNSYHLLDLTVYGRQEMWEDSPAGWPQPCTYTRTSSGAPTWTPTWPGGRPIAQWPRLEAGYSDDLGTGRH